MGVMRLEEAFELTSLKLVLVLLDPRVQDVVSLTQKYARNPNPHIQGQIYEEKI